MSCEGQGKYSWHATLGIVRGYSKTFPRDFLTFFGIFADSFSRYSLEHAAASVGNKDNATHRVPYSRLIYIMYGF